MVKDLLDSHEPIDHVIVEDMLINEEKVCIEDRDRTSYYTLINQILGV